MLTLEPLQPADAEAVGALLAQALHFNLPNERLLSWIERRGFASFRVARLDGALAAALNIIDMGQWFGGRAIPTAGISAVGVAPEYRGRKVGAALMESMLREQRANGVFLSTLYPATTQFYRTLGYERAGARTLYELAPASIAVRAPEGHVLVPAPAPAGGAPSSPAESPEAQAAADAPWAADRARFNAVYEQSARHQSGNLVRPPVMWDRVLKPLRGSPFRYFVRDGAGAEVGYVVFNQAGQFEDLTVLDWCALTPAAARALLAFLAGHRTLVEKAIAPGAPVDPILQHLTEQRSKINWQLDWMLRLIDVREALGLRGYPAELRAELHLDLADERLEWNRGRFVVQIADGRAVVEPGGAGRVALHVRDLAALYASYLAPTDLSVAGSLRGPAADLATLALAFAGPRPWMPDMF